MQLVVVFLSCCSLLARWHPLFIANIDREMVHSWQEQPSPYGNVGRIDFIGIQLLYRKRSSQSYKQRATSVEAERTMQMHVMEATNTQHLVLLAPCNESMSHHIVLTLWCSYKEECGFLNLFSVFLGFS